MRKRLYEIIEVSKENDKESWLYDVCMMITIIVSLVPLAFKETNTVFMMIDYITAGIFIVDYALRFITADYKIEQKFEVGGKSVCYISAYTNGANRLTGNTANV